MRRRVCAGRDRSGYGAGALAENAVDAAARYGLNLEPGINGAWQTFMTFFWQQGGEIMDPAIPPADFAERAQALFSGLGPAPDALAAALDAAGRLAAEVCQQHAQ